MFMLFGEGIQTRLLNDGLNDTVPETEPRNDPVPSLGLVWLIVSVKTTPDGKFCIIPGVQETHCVTNEPKSTREPDT